MINHDTQWDSNAHLDLEECNPWPTIFKAKYDFDFENKLKPKVIDSLKTADQVTQKLRIETPEKDGGVTSVVLATLQKKHRQEQITQPHEWSEFGDFKEFVTNTASRVVRKWHCDPGSPRSVTRSWINVHPQGAYTEEHMHHGVLMAVAAYLYVPPNGGNLLVKNPLTPYKFSEPMHRQYFSRGGEDGLEWSTVQVETGDVLFFPGWLTHKTEKNSSTENRFVMSWNISFTTEVQIDMADSKDFYPEFNKY